MFNEPRLSANHDDLVRVVRHVRGRWRLKIAMRGSAIVLGAGILAFLLSAYGLEYFRFSPEAVIAFRVLTYVVLAGLAVMFLVRPLLKRVSDEQVALYLEEHEPSLQAAVLSALEAGKEGDVIHRPDRSAALVRRLIESTIEKCWEIDAGRAVERNSLRRSSGMFGAGVIAALLLFLFGPSYLQDGARALLPTGSLEAASPYHIDVLPGDATIARGSDQTITAHLLGFESEGVDVLLRSSPNAPFERLPLIPQVDSNGYEAMLFDIQDETEYFVQSAGVRSAVFTFEVIDLPYVERLELEYHFPAYTQLAPRVIENGGDIAVLQGTEVRLRAFPTMGTPAGQILFDEADAKALTLTEDGAFTMSFEVSEEGFYRIELEGPEGEMITASPQYTIDVLTDQPPSVSFVKPGRDSTGSPIEEVYVEARADDDFGVKTLALTYSVNGGPEQTVNLYGGGSTLKEVSAGHTFFLEELALVPGDFVSYYAQVADNNQAEDATPVKSDLYFVQVRAFRKDFRAAESQAGGGGGGGAGADPRALSQQQREVISATFNVIRDRDGYSAGEYRENLVFLTLAQGRLREQVESLVTRLNSRVVSPDPAFRAIAETLPKAMEEMRAAEEQLQAQNATDALPPEQRALQHLQRAEEAYQEVQVTMGSGGGGGGDGSRSAAEDLADLFELELDRLQNQYETMERGQQQAADEQVDELMERLNELARRQEQEAERRRRRASNQRSAQGGGGAGQRALAEETEEAARRLERLARETNRPDLMDAARRLQEAADAMRRAAADADDLGLGEATAALDRLRDARRRLEQEQADRLTRDIEDARRRVQALVQAEQGISRDVDRLVENPGDRREQLRRLLDRKAAMEAEVGDLERQLDTTAADFRREERDASQKLQEAANSIRENRLKEKIRYTMGLIQTRSPANARPFEGEITSDINELRELLSEAAAAVGRSEQDVLARALDQTQDLMRGMESLEQRMRETGQQNDQQDGQQAGQEDGSQGGQQGGQQGGSGSGNGAFGDTLSPFGGGGGLGPRWPGTYAFTDEQIRQFRGELRERGVDAQELRRLLAEEAFDLGDLDEIIQAMRALDSLRDYADAEEIARLQTYVVEGLKRFEYRLRREIDTDTDQLFLAGSDEVPAGFRELIEEYYRSLAREQSP